MRRLLLLGLLAAASCGPQRVDELEVFRYRQADLETNRAAPPPQALEQLRRDAEAALQHPARSVMDKKLVAASGDPHDYLSIALYAWPDPDAPDAAWTIRDGQPNQATWNDTDKGALTELTRDAQTLALAWYFFGDERYAQRLAQRLETWFIDPATRMNPHAEYAQAIPGVKSGNSFGIIDLGGLPRIVEAVGLIRNSPAWSTEQQQGMEDWCDAYYHWLTTSPMGLREEKMPNNHGSWYDVQATALALFLGKLDEARDRLERAKMWRIDHQIAADGHQPREFSRSRTFHYYTYNLHALFQLAQLGDSIGVDLWSAHDQRLLRALELVRPFADPNTSWPHPERQFERRSLLPLLLIARHHYPAAPNLTALEHFDAATVAPMRLHLLLPKE